jgi:PAS domain S-box-containing protein
LSFFFWYHRSRKFTEDRYKTEEALRASEARYRSFVEKTSIVSWTTNPAGEVTEDIPSFRAFTGQSYEDVKGNGWSKGVHPDDLSKTLEVWKKAVETKGEYNIIYRLKRYDGEYRYMSIRGVPVLDVKGKIQEWIGTGQDITEQKIAENKLKQREASLNDAQRLTHLGSWDYDIVNNNLAWSDEFYRIYEINPAEFGASYEAFLAAVHPDDRDFVDKSYTNSVKNKTPYNIVHRLLMADGRIKYIHEIGETFYDETGKPLRSIGTGQDITERKLAQDKIQNLNDELEKRVAKRTAQLESANKELETFSYSVSHDLRTPLRAIDGYSMILLEEYNDKLDDEGKRLLNVVRSNTERMSKLIDDILHFSRAGRASISFSDTDLESVLKDILESLEPEIKKKSIQINVGQLPRAVCDRGMIHQVFENLITNAVKFSGKKENPVIEIAGKIEGDNAIYYVKDNGAGFDMKYVSKLFGVFQRLHSDEEFEGTGIGLAIVKQIINRHGGSVWAESEPEKGATFYFSIPLVQTIQEAEHDTQ